MLPCWPMYRSPQKLTIFITRKEIFWEKVSQKKKYLLFQTKLLVQTLLVFRPTSSLFGISNAPVTSPRMFLLSFWNNVCTGSKTLRKKWFDFDYCTIHVMDLSSAFLSRRNIGKLTPKLIYFHHLTKHFLDQRFQKNILFNFEKRSTGSKYLYTILN